MQTTQTVSPSHMNWHIHSGVRHDPLCSGWPAPLTHSQCFLRMSKKFLRMSNLSGFGNSIEATLILFPLPRSRDSEPNTPRANLVLSPVIAGEWWALHTPKVCYTFHVGCTSDLAQENCRSSAVLVLKFEAQYIRKDPQRIGTVQGPVLQHGNPNR